MVGTLCERCQRLMAIGVLVDAAEPADGSDRHVAALDAVAFLLTDHALLRRRHRRELREADQDGQRGARDSYAAGLMEGMDQRNRG